MAGSALLLLSVVTWAEGQAQKGREPQTQKGKEPELPPMPKGFDKARTGIEKGKVETLEYDSKTTNSKRKLVTYTPPGYSKDKKYPVFYLLHGAGGNETNWTKQGSANTILDNLYADKKVVAMVVVMPNAAVKGGAGGKGGKGASAFEGELLNDIMPYIEDRYSIHKDAEHRALAGLSLGGGQTMQVGLKHMDKFAWLGGFSSALQGASAASAADGSKKLKLLYIACGDADTLYNANKNFHASLESAKVTHVWNVVPGGAHNFPVWKNDLYLFSQMIFKEKDKK